MLSSPSELEYAARILGVDSDLVVDQLIQRNIQMRGETVTSPLNYSNACDVKDAFIKGERKRHLSRLSGLANNSFYMYRPECDKKHNDSCLK